jgi:hypothetical protein
VRGFWWVLRRATGTGEGIVVGIEEGCWHGVRGLSWVLRRAADSGEGIVVGIEEGHWHR